MKKRGYEKGQRPRNQSTIDARMVEERTNESNFEVRYGRKKERKDRKRTIKRMTDQASEQTNA